MSWLIMPETSAVIQRVEVESVGDPGDLRAGRLSYAAGRLSAIDPVVMPMDFVEWARGAAAVAIQHDFP